MKIGIVCPYDWSYPGGVKTHITGLAAALRRRGDEVRIIAPASSERAGISVAGRSVGIPLNGSVARLCFTPRAASRVMQFSRDVDILHLHEPGIPSVSMLALFAGLPAVATFHASAERSRMYGAAAPVLNPLLKRLKSRIVVSAAAQRLIARYFPSDYELIPNGIDLEPFEQASHLPELVGADPLVLFVGRNEPRKGLSVAVQAMRLVREVIPVRFAVVGPDRADVPDWVTVLDKVSPVRLPSIYRSADVFVAPSLRGESFGLVLVEAMAAGTPVVASDLPGYIDAAAGAAMHAPAGNAEATSARILELLDDPAKCAALVDKGAARARELSWDLLVDRVREIYGRALS